MGQFPHRSLPSATPGGGFASSLPRLGCSALRGGASVIWGAAQSSRLFRPSPFPPLAPARPCAGRGRRTASAVNLRSAPPPGGGRSGDSRGPSARFGVAPGGGPDRPQSGQGEKVLSRGTCRSGPICLRRLSHGLRLCWPPTPSAGRVNSLEMANPCPSPRPDEDGRGAARRQDPEREIDPLLSRHLS